MIQANNNIFPHSPLLLDTPITSITDDRLGRKPMVKNIAAAILNRSKDTHSCYTIGIYGKWGEGKTSVLEMVCEQIEVNDNNNLEVIKFNPWLFKDQESLLLNFFEVLREGVDSKHLKKTLRTYGRLVAFGISGLLSFAPSNILSLIGWSLKKVVAFFTNKDIDFSSLKSKVNSAIEESHKHLLIIIDDVDRLDKDEMHALFKLIRQNADFVNTTYLIAMDVDMVAKSIGERFEGGNEKAGYSFLEKIVQVPIYLPTIQHGHLYYIFKKTVLKQIEELCNKNGMADTANRFKKAQQTISTHALSLITTVREIYQYHNTLMFVLPHIIEEVNIEDIALLELLKLFHCEAYYRIRESKALVTMSDEQALLYLMEKPEDKEKRIDAFMESLWINAELTIQTYIKSIVSKLLFPLTSSNKNALELRSEKRLCSADYFDKYFIHTIPDGMISDSETDSLINKISSIGDNDFLQLFNHYVSEYGYEELRRIVYQIVHAKERNNINNDSIEKIGVALSQLSMHESRTEYTYGTKVYEHLAEMDICKIIDTYVDERYPGYSPVKNKEKQLAIYKRIFSIEEPLLFHLFIAVHLCERYTTFNEDIASIYEPITKMIGKFVKQRSVDKIFNLSLVPMEILFFIWKNQNEEEYSKVVNNHIAKEDFDLPGLMYKIMRKRNNEDFDRFARLFDVKVVYERMKQVDVKSEFREVVEFFVRKYEKDKFN